MGATESIREAVAVYDFDQIAGMVRRAEVAGLERLIRSGWDVDQDDGHTGTTPLLLACEAGRVEVVALLLRHGADPNLGHRDGHNCYDATPSRRIRELLVAHGFSQRTWAETRGRGLAGLRVLDAHAPVTRVWSVTVSGPAPSVEYRLWDFPEPAGRAVLAATVAGRPAYTVTITEAGHHLRPLTTPARDATPADAAITLTLDQFRGELRVRLFCAATIADNDGPPGFWLPDWTD